MNSDPEFGKRISKKVEEIKADKKNLSDIAQTYESKYKQEILEGTEFRNRLITEGTKQGLSEEQILGSLGRFVPCVRTPILNLLYFMLRESENDTYFGRGHYERRDQMNESLIKTGKASIDESYKNVNFSDMSESEAEHILDEFLDESFASPSSPQRNALNASFESERLSRPKEEEVKLKEPENMVEYLYGDLTLAQFDVLKKLKALASCNVNPHESFLAWKKGNDLCKKYGLEWDKIPSSIKHKT